MDVDVVFTTNEGCRVRALTLPEAHPSHGNVLLELRMMDPEDGRQAAIILTPEEWAKLTGAGS